MPKRIRVAWAVLWGTPVWLVPEERIRLVGNEGRPQRHLDPPRLVHPSNLRPLNALTPAEVNRVPYAEPRVI